MKSNLILTSTKDMSQETWLAWRKRGVGGSDVSTVMGLNPYRSALEFFYMQIGEGLPYSVENMAQFIGKETENFTANLWQYYEGSEESMIRNYREGKIVRRMRKINSYVQNPKFPHLFVSLDRIINKTPERGEGALELKTTSSWEAEKYINSIPPSYVLQLQTQLMVTEFEYGELAVFIDGRRFEVYPFEPHRDIMDAIAEKTRIFWDKVQQARIVKTRQYNAQMNFNYRLVDECEAEISTLEPEPDNSTSLNSFLKEKYKIANPGERTGTDEQLQHAILHKGFADKIKELNKQKQLHENHLKAAMKDDIEKLDFGANGSVYWKGEPRKFFNRIKN